MNRRAAVVVGLFVALALSVGVGVVLAGASPSRISLEFHGPVARAPVVLHPSVPRKRILVGHALKSDRSPPLRSMDEAPVPLGPETEASPNPRGVSQHVDRVDTVRQDQKFPPNMPAPGLSFDGIQYGAVSNLAPPDTNGEAGLTQYVQTVNSGYQVFDKATGASLLGPVTMATLWQGFGGVCQFNGRGDPVVLYDQLANRWLLSQFAGTSIPTDECIAISTTPDATGTYYRYAFHLGDDYFDYPHFGLWPDGYYLSMNVFAASGVFVSGPQPFAFDRAAMLRGDPEASFITTRDRLVFNGDNDWMLPADLDGPTPPPTGAPAPFLMSGELSTWRLWRFHADFANPASSTFTPAGYLTPAPYTGLCHFTRVCIPQQGVAINGNLDGIGDRGMFRLAYRNFGDHEALVGNQSVLAGGVAGIRWYEIENATSGAPGFSQESTYQPDTTFRWMGSTGMDSVGDLALGFSASSASIVPGIRYAGRLAGDPVSELAQGEETLFAGAGSQIGTQNRWGDYSDLSIDPVDDCTFWFTTEYYPAGVSSFNWRTRIGNFRFPSCFKARPLVVTRVGKGRSSISSSPAGLGCRAACSGLFADGATVTLSATAGPSSLFRGWSGDCHGTGACVVSMTGGHSVTATFHRPLAPPVCRVPKAVGTTLARARTMIAKAHCRVGKISRKATRAGKRGKVLGQSPNASKRLKSGAKVNLTVGK